VQRVCWSVGRCYCALCVGASSSDERHHESVFVRQPLLELLGHSAAVMVVVSVQRVCGSVVVTVHRV